MNVKTKEQFAKQFKELHPTLTLLSDYTNSSSPIKVKCNICGKNMESKGRYFKKYSLYYM